MELLARRALLIARPAAAISNVCWGHDLWRFCDLSSYAVLRYGLKQGLKNEMQRKLHYCGVKFKLNTLSTFLGSICEAESQEIWDPQQQIALVANSLPPEVQEMAGKLRPARACRCPAGPQKMQA